MIMRGDIQYPPTKCFCLSYYSLDHDKYQNQKIRSGNRYGALYTSLRAKINLNNCL